MMISAAILTVRRHLIRPALLSGSRSSSLLSNFTANYATPSPAVSRTSSSHRIQYGRHTASIITILTSVVLATSYTLSIGSCESPGPADETEDSNDIIIRDGFDAGSENPISTPSTDEVAEEDDPENDEETTCSICLINRQGPCRRHWLKFERCMKDHSAEKERKENEREANSVVREETKEPTLEEEWDGFMEKSITPGEDEEEEEEEEEEEDDDENEENDETKQNRTEDTGLSLGERCDKFMIPWISCIQEHRNVYSLISNAFYQQDYVDPLEESIPNNQRRPFTKVESSIGEKEGYIVKFRGVEVDLGNWREHVEADADDGDEFADEEDSLSQSAPKNVEEPHLINAYAKIKLSEPETGNPIEVAYIKDQKGRLLGFDSFSKRDTLEKENENNIHDDQEKVHDGSTMEHEKRHDGECTFHIVPDDTTSVVAYAIYRTKRVDEKGEEQRDYVLYYTPQIPLPGNQSDK